jgi:serine phosphatase RsbU (regulator of sigma subunit)/anti-sigma regulatory factor (Ser/Thr protein kinase)
VLSLPDRHAAPKGSWRWSVRVAELTAWGTTALVVALLHIADLDTTTYRWGLVISGILAVWLLLLFHVLIARMRNRRWALWVVHFVNLSFASAGYGLLREDVPAVALIFVPVLLATGLLGGIPEALIAPLAALGGIWLVAEISRPSIETSELALTGGVFLLAGVVAGLLARELRKHYRAEHEEHRLATAVRYRLMAVLDAVDEAIVFSDLNGVVRIVNQRADRLFAIGADEHLGLATVQLLRTIARKTEDPEGFMETFQQLRDQPELEIRSDIEQIIPARRQLRLYSGPARDESGVLVGRIDVYTDVTEAVRRAEEVERLYEQARSTAESYQRSLLPEETPALPRVGIVAHYVPAAGPRAVCGDFYDFIHLPDGRLGVVLGDVCGVGPQAVGDAALARYTLKSFVPMEPDPARLLSRMNAHLQVHLAPDRFVRLVIGVLDPERATLEYASAGHVPPVAFHCKSGEVEWLGEGGLPLGVEEDAEYKIGRIEFDPGDMLVLYTDGVTEADRGGRPYGQGRFLDLVEAYGVGTPGEMSQAIRRSVDAWVEDEAMRDDLAIIVCQVVPDATIGEPTRELVLPNETSRLREMRSFIAGYLADVRAPVDISTEVLLAAGEATANACRHGRREGARTEVRVKCSLQGTKVAVTVADDGPGFDPSQINPGSLPDRFASGGRGLFLIRKLMDDVDINSSSEGTIITMTRRLGGDGRNAVRDT